MITARSSRVIAIVIVVLLPSPAVAGWRAGWKFEPFGISINDKGEVSFSLSYAIQTPVGVFFFGRDEAINPRPGYTYVAVRNHRTRTTKVYEVYSGDDELTVGVESGNVTIKDRVITIDISGYGYSDLKYEIGRLKEQHATELAEARRQGYDDGQAQGQAAGYRHGYASGEREGERVGNAQGYQRGVRDGDLKAVYKAGQTVGYAQGAINGFSRGVGVGHKRGFAEGRTQGLEEGTSQGMKEGYAKGFDSGRNAGVLEERMRQAAYQARQDLQEARYRGSLTAARRYARANDPVLTQAQPSWGDIQRSLNSKNISMTAYQR